MSPFGEAKLRLLSFISPCDTNTNPVSMDRRMSSHVGVSISQPYWGICNNVIVAMSTGHQMMRLTHPTDDVSWYRLSTLTPSRVRHNDSFCVVGVTVKPNLQPNYWNKPLSYPCWRVLAVTKLWYGARLIGEHSPENTSYHVCWQASLERLQTTSRSGIPQS